jgi:hypothetical protein
VAATYQNERCGQAGQAGCLLTVFYGKNKGEQLQTPTTGKGKNPATVFRPTGDMIFPQHGTMATTFSSSSYLFWGYRELGRELVRQLRYDPLSGRLELNAQQCKQPALKGIKRERPRDTDDGMACIPV